MKTRCLTALLVGCCLLLHGPNAPAQPNPRAALVSASPDSALLHLTVAWVNAGPMREGGPVRWRYRPGLPPGWASPATNDRGWLLARTQFMLGNDPPGWHGTGCFRLHFTVDSALVGQALCLQTLHEGASEIYLDGRLLGGYGTVGPTLETTKGYFPRHEVLSFVLRTAGPHLLAVRYAKFGKWAFNRAGFSAWVASPGHILAQAIDSERLDMSHLFVSVAIGVLTLLHFLLFLFYRSQRAYLYYSLYTGVLVGYGLLHYLRVTLADEDLRWWVQLGSQASEVLSPLLLLAFVYSVCQVRLTRRWLGLLGLGGAVLLVLMQPTVTDKRLLPLYYGLILMPWLDMLRVLGRALWQRRPGVGLVAVGVVATIRVDGFALWDLFHLWPDYFSMQQQLVTQLEFLVLPVCMAAYLARDFATTRRSLETQLRQVEQLSAHTLAMETERRQLVSIQNERLEATVQARTEEISHQNHILAAQRDEISAQADRLRALDQEKTRFFTNITHEFRTPLTLMLGPAAQIAADTREPATRQQAQLVQRNAQRLLHLINQLLDLSRLEAGQLALDPAPADVVAFVRGLAGAFESLAEQRGIGFSFEADRPALTALLDADKLEKVVVNLLSNAFKFTPSAGEVAVHLRVAEAPGWLELTVRDTGRGIAPEQLPHVFDRFYQADASDTRTHEGTGIGLALTKELVELHGGTIALASVPGRGTTATVRLPLLPAAEAAPAPPSSAGGPAAGARPKAEAATMPPAVPAEAPLVLLIEDNADMRAYLRTVLAPDYHLLEAENGAAGVALACEHLPDLVLTDAMMPILDGYGVCRALKHNERTSHIPVVLLTAKADLPSRLQGLDTGADAYLTKPFRREELLAQLRNLVLGRQQLQGAYRRALAEAPPPGPPTMEEAFLARVRQAIELALDDETLDVQTLARTLALSRTQLHRKLKALTGQAPSDLIRLLRLNRAHELLAGGTATVAEVAYQVGYGNPANFSTSYSHHFGYAPSETRRQAAILSSEN